VTTQNSIKLHSEKILPQKNNSNVSNMFGGQFYHAFKNSRAGHKLEKGKYKPWSSKTFGQIPI
jgi:hypothetical protein